MENDVLESWFGSLDVSPTRYNMNLFSSAILDNDGLLRMNYIYKDFSRKLSRIDTEEYKEHVLYLPVESLNMIDETCKSISICPCEGMKSDHLCIYGFINMEADVSLLATIDDSTLIEASIDRISPELTQKFKEVEISVNFGSYASMKKVLEMISESLLAEGGTISVHMDSTFINDDTRRVTLAEAIGYGYLSSSILPDIRIPISLMTVRLNMYDNSFFEEFDEEYTRYSALYD